MAEAQGVSVVIDEDDDTVRVDPVTGTVETDQPDGGVIVQLDAHRPSKDDDSDDFYRNLADEIDAMKLGQIANELCDAIGADDRSRGNYLAIRARGMDFLGLELKEPRANAGDSSAAVEGMSTVTNPLLLEAILKGWANAQAELLPSSGPVKVGDDEGIQTPASDDLADALERDMNYYFTVTASEYYPDTSHMLLWGTYFGGSGFKKVYRCPMRRRPVSESVDAKDLIVSDTTKDLRSCGRITHQIPMRPSVMKRMRLLKAYRDSTPLPQPMPQPNAVDAKIAGIQGTEPTPQRPEDQPYTLWESQCELDLPDFAPGKFKDEGIPLPYLVTIDKDAKEILSIRRDWREDDEECERKRMYVRYPYVPGPGFYGTGMLNILGNSTAAMTAAWREALDAGMFANFPSFLIAKLAGRQNTSDVRLSPGTGYPLETNGQPIGQIAMPLPYRDVTPGLLALIDKITQQSQSLGGAADIPTAEGIQNVPVGTMLAQIEQATKVMAAAHKGMHQAQAEEIRLIVDLFREHPEDFWKSNKLCPKGFWDEQKFLQALNDCELVPASDPNTPSHIHRVAKAVALSQLYLNPAFAVRLDPKEGLLRILAAMREDPKGLVIDPPAQAPAPDPKLLAAAAANKVADARQTEAQVKAASAGQDAQLKQADLSTQRDVATVKLASEMVIHKHDAEKDAQKQANDAALAAQDQQTKALQGVQAHGLNVVQAAHDQNMDIAGHALEVHKVLNPPPIKPAGKTK